MRDKLVRKRVLVPLVAALAVCGVAVAAWFVQTTGPAGIGQTGSVGAPTVTNVTPTGVDCFPGQTCDVQVTINNQNSSPLTLTTLTLTGTPTVHVEKPLGTDITGVCPASNFGFGSLTGLSVTVPPGSSTVTVPGAFSMAAAAPNGCMGAYVFVSGSNHTWTFTT